MLERILVPLDGSAKAERILGLLPLLGRRSPCHATVVRIVEASGPPLADEENLLRGAQAYLNRIAAEHSSERVQIRTAVKVGPIARSILTLAGHARASLVAMSMVGDRSVPATSLGANLRTLIEESDLPLLLAPPHLPAQPERTSPGNRPGKLLVVADTEESPELLVPPAAAAAEILELEVVLLEVVPVARTGRGEAEARATAEDHLSPFRRAFEELGINPDPIIEPGDPERTVQEIAQDEEVGLIALGAASLALSGSPSPSHLPERLLLEARVPVLVAPKRAS